MEMRFAKSYLQGLKGFKPVSQLVLYIKGILTYMSEEISPLLPNRIRFEWEDRNIVVVDMLDRRFVVATATVDISMSGFPVTISWLGGSYDAMTLESLTEAFGNMLENPTVARIIAYSGGVKISISQEEMTLDENVIHASCHLDSPRETTNG